MRIVSEFLAAKYANNEPRKTVGKQIPLALVSG
jgi:hypothetical protein